MCSSLFSEGSFVSYPRFENTIGATHASTTATCAHILSQPPLTHAHTTHVHRALPAHPLPAVPMCATEKANYPLSFCPCRRKGGQYTNTARRRADAFAISRAGGEWLSASGAAGAAGPERPERPPKWKSGTENSNIASPVWHVRKSCGVPLLLRSLSLALSHLAGWLFLGAPFIGVSFRTV